MNKYPIIMLLIGILIGLGAGYFLCSVVNEQPRLENPPLVGIFYYAWYDEGYGGHHWSDRVQWTVVDEPLLGYYDSQNESIILKHLDWFRDLQVDFVVVSWWGPDSYEDASVKKLFSVVNSTRTAEGYTRPQLAIFVEPFNETEGGYNYAQIYSYVYDNFVLEYPDVYFSLENKPLICFFNYDYLTPDGVVPEDSRFTSIVVGHHYVDYCVDWVFEHITPHWVGPVPHNRTYSVCPRYDDSRLSRPEKYVVDPEYMQHVYDREWRNALGFAQEGALDLILINSWNEFNERSMIEPHNDATSFTDDPYYLYNITRQYIEQIKGET